MGAELYAAGLNLIPAPSTNGIHIEHDVKTAEGSYSGDIVADHKKMTAKLARVPKIDEIPYPAIMEPNLVVEYYSR